MGSEEAAEGPCRVPDGVSSAARAGVDEDVDFAVGGHDPGGEGGDVVCASEGFSFPGFGS